MRTKLRKIDGKIRKPKMKTMYAAVQAIYDREDLEDSTVEIIGVYSSRKIAGAELEKAKLKFLAEIDDDPGLAEENIEDDYDRSYNWFVQKVKVEAN
jgi:hypothetical protein